MRYITRTELKTELAALAKPWFSEAEVIKELRAFARDLSEDKLTAEQLSGLILITNKGLLEKGSAQIIFKGLQAQIAVRRLTRGSVNAFGFHLILAKEGLLTEESKRHLEIVAREYAYFFEPDTCLINEDGSVYSGKKDGSVYSGKVASLVIKLMSMALVETDRYNCVYHKTITHYPYLTHRSLDLANFLAETNLNEEQWKCLETIITDISGRSFIESASHLLKRGNGVFLGIFEALLSMQSTWQAAFFLTAIDTIGHQFKEGKEIFDVYLVNRYKADLIKDKNPQRLAMIIHALNHVSPQFLAVNYDKCKALSESFPNVYRILIDLARYGALHQGNLNDLIKYAAIINHFADKTSALSMEKTEKLFTKCDDHAIKRMERLFTLCDRHAPEGDAEIERVVQSVLERKAWELLDYPAKTWAPEELQVPAVLESPPTPDVPEPAVIVAGAGAREKAEVIAEFPPANAGAGVPTALGARPGSVTIAAVSGSLFSARSAPTSLVAALPQIGLAADIPEGVTLELPSLGRS